MNQFRWQRPFVAFGLFIASVLNNGGLLFADNLRDAAPPDAYLAMWGQQNPERDYMKIHEQAIWDEIAKSKICEKALHILQSHMSEGDAQQFVTIRETLQNAITPVEWSKVANAKEVMYAQKMEGPTSLHLLMVRIPDGGAESLRQGMENLFTLAAGASQGKLPLISETVAGTEMKYLQLPAEIPFTLQPAIGVKGDIFVFTTSLNFAKSGLELLDNPSADSKFDDVRVISALKQLPEAEDALVFMDGKRLFAQLNEIPQFITRVSNNQPDALRVAEFLTEIIKQSSALDHEITVQYTEGFQQRMATYGQLTENANETVVGKMAIDQQPFEDWESFVPENALGFSLTTGINLLPVYDWLMKEVPERFPEANRGLEQFSALQNQHDIHLREDILQAFPGESISISLPGPVTMLGKQPDTVLMLRCTQPDRTEELIHRGINAIADIPLVAQYGITMDEVPGLDGFFQINASALAALQIAPVIGFQDGWMIVGSKASAVEAVLAAKNGDAAAWADGDRFKEFGLAIDGPVNSINFTNTGENIRAASTAMQQIGMMAPMMLSVAKRDAGDRQAKAVEIVQELSGLLPPLGRIVGKMDFYDATMKVCLPGPESNSYIRYSVTLVTPPTPPNEEDAVDQKQRVERQRVRHWWYQKIQFNVRKVSYVSVHPGGRRYSGDRRRFCNGSGKEES